MQERYIMRNSTYHPNNTSKDRSGDGNESKIISVLGTVEVELVLVFATSVSTGLL